MNYSSQGSRCLFTSEYNSLYQNYGKGETRCYVFEKDGTIVVYPFLMNSISPLDYAFDKEYCDIQWLMDDGCRYQ